MNLLSNQDCCKTGPKRLAVSNCTSLSMKMFLSIPHINWNQTPHGIFNLKEVQLIAADLFGEHDLDKSLTPCMQL